MAWCKRAYLVISIDTSSRYHHLVISNVYHSQRRFGKAEQKTTSGFFETLFKDVSTRLRIRKIETSIENPDFKSSFGGDKLVKIVDWTSSKCRCPFNKARYELLNTDRYELFSMVWCKLAWRVISNGTSSSSCIL
jgi:hypothetical protein